MPRQVDHAERRSQITAATWRAIDELGVGGTSMRNIAERAGCTTGRVSHYFERREDVLVAALQVAHGRAAARMARHLEGRSPVDALRAVLLEALPLDDERRAEWKVWLVFWAEGIAIESLRVENATRYREWRRLLTSLVAAAAPDRPRAEARRAAETLVALIDGLGTQVTLAADPAAAGRRARATLDAALDALLATG